jgi:hypothetical protein
MPAATSLGRSQGHRGPGESCKSFCSADQVTAAAQSRDELMKGFLEKLGETIELRADDEDPRVHI